MRYFDILKWEDVRQYDIGHVIQSSFNPEKHDIIELRKIGILTFTGLHKLFLYRKSSGIFVCFDIPDENNVKLVDTGRMYSKYVVVKSIGNIHEYNEMIIHEYNKSHYPNICQTSI